MVGRSAVVAGQLGTCQKQIVRPFAPPRYVMGIIFFISQFSRLLGSRPREYKNDDDDDCVCNLSIDRVSQTTFNPKIVTF